MVIGDRYFSTVTQVMVVTVNFRSDDLNVSTRNHWFNSYIVS